MQNKQSPRFIVCLDLKFSRGFASELPPALFFGPSESSSKRLSGLQYYQNLFVIHLNSIFLLKMAAATFPEINLAS